MACMLTCQKKTKKVAFSNVFVNGKFGVLLPSSPNSNVEHPASNEKYAILDNNVERADSRGDVALSATRKQRTRDVSNPPNSWKRAASIFHLHGNQNELWLHQLDRAYKCKD